MEQLDPESAQIREVYARFGLAVYQAQCVERQLAILLATKCGPGVNRTTRSQYDELLESLFKETFGSLISRLRKTIDVSGDFKESLKTALRYRNWLAHSYFWERAGHFMTEKGRSFMIEELQEVADFLYDFDKRLHSVVREGLATNGMDNETFQSDVEKLMQEIIQEAGDDTSPA